MKGTDGPKRDRESTIGYENKKKLERFENSWPSNASNLQSETR